MGNGMMRFMLVCLPVLAIVLGFVLATPHSPADTPQAPSAEKEPAPAAGEPAAEGGRDEAMIDPLGPNSACYVCHMTFVFEELAKTHLAEKVTCIECHGLSAAHANDENIGATKPDITYKREKIDASCQKCHETHDVAANEVVARFLERQLKDPKLVCTDCHGMHRIEHAEEEPAAEEASPPKSPTPAPESGPKTPAS